MSGIDFGAVERRLGCKVSVFWVDELVDLLSSECFVRSFRRLNVGDSGCAVFVSRNSSSIVLLVCSCNYHRRCVCVEKRVDRVDLDVIGLFCGVAEVLAEEISVL